ncbi:MAG: amino acid ABC transporter permease [Lachnospiraceae bacterium]|nr:amino acid ABC transporter permease [Lachnospiraceae bacterium]
MKGTEPLIYSVLYEPPGKRGRTVINICTALSLLLIAGLICAVVMRFYETGQLDARYWSFFVKWTTWRFLLNGLLGTMEASLAAAVFAMILGFAMMLMRIGKNRVINKIATGLIEFTRGVPTLLFIYFFFLVLPQYGVKLQAIWKISLPVAISASGVVAEVLRSGINAVPKGQREAALSLGLSEAKTLWKILIPQAFRIVIPALIAELVIVVKDTTFAYVVSFPDLMQNSKVLISNYDAMLSVYLVTAVIYILINYILNRISAFSAGRMQTG